MGEMAHLSPLDRLRLAWVGFSMGLVALSWIMQGRTAFAVAAGAVLVAGGFGLILESIPSKGRRPTRLWRPVSFAVLAALGLLEVGSCVKDPYGVGAGESSLVPVRLGEVALRGSDWTHLGLDSGYSVTCSLWVYGVAIAWMVGLLLLGVVSVSDDTRKRGDS